MKLILGSQSKNRQEVLRRAGIEFEIQTADIDEKAIRHDDYEQLPLLLARAKADALIKEIAEPALLVTADTVTTFHGELREKPESPEQAQHYLETYSRDEPIIVITAVTVTNTVSGQRAEGIDVAELTIDKLPPQLVAELVDDPLSLTVAGGFTVLDERLQPYFVGQKGSDTSIAGLPLELMERLSKEVTT